MKVPNEIVLQYSRMPGDAVVLTALLRDLHRHYEGRIKVDVRTKYEVLFEHNPYRTKLHTRRALTVELVAQPLIKEAGKGTKIHFLRGLHEALRQRAKIECPVYEPRPDLHLGPHEQEPLVEGRYWVLVAGGRENNTIKHWSWKGYQQVADGIRSMGLNVVQLGAVERGHHHAALTGTTNLVGRTGLRQAMNVISWADGVVCPVTFAMHVAAAFERPCVVIAGGREEPWWEWYGGYPEAFGSLASPVRIPHRFLHTLGQLSCCQTRGCWKRQVLAKDEKACRLPDRNDPQQPLATCMSMITPEMVLAAIRSYYIDGTLPPS